MSSPNNLNRKQKYVDLVCAASIQPEPIKWLWEGYLAIGKLTLLAGAPGTGKTTLALSIATIFANGGIRGLKWPDGKFAPAGDVIIYSGEDGLADTTIPRLLAAGVSIDRIHVIRATTEDGQRRPFNAATDFGCLNAPLSQNRSVGLLIIDPIISLIAGDSHRNQDVRKSMAPVLEMAEKYNFAVLGLTHIAKGSKGKEALDRVIGSIGFSAVARIVLLTAKVKSSTADGGPSRSFLIRAKSNIGPDDGGLAYHIESVERETAQGMIQTSRICWDDEPLEGSANELLRYAEGENESNESSRLDEAVEFLVGFLRQGEMPYPHILAKAKEVGITSASLKRAKLKLRVKHRKQTGMGCASPSLWSLPQDGYSTVSASYLATQYAPSIFCNPSLFSNSGFSAPLGSVEPLGSVAPLESVDPFEPIQAQTQYEQEPTQSIYSLIQERKSKAPTEQLESAGSPEPVAPLDSAADTADNHTKEAEDHYLNYLISECRERFRRDRIHEEIEDNDDLWYLCLRINNEVLDQAYEDCENLPNVEVVLEKYRHLLDQTQWWL